MNNLRGKKVLVTGSSGFIGLHLVRKLKDLGCEVVGVSRSNKVNSSVLRDISGETDWSDLLKGIDIIIHCAAVVHQKKLSKTVLNSYQRVNVEGTLNLAQQAKATVKRFIFLSSVKVNGEESFNTKFYADDVTNPTDPYSVSKDLAEKGLKKISKSSRMEVVIIRPVLVYGPSVKGNLVELVKYLSTKKPLPFGRINFNSRSLVFIGNLINFIQICAEHPAAKDEIFLISDDYDLSTVDIINHLSKALNISPKLFPVPVIFLKFFFRILRKRNYESRLLGNLRVDVTKNKQLLDWKPNYTVEEAFRASFTID